MSTDVCGPTLAAQITRVLAANDAASGVQTAIEPPGDGVGYWAGGPSAVYVDGTFWVAYRLRRPVDQGRGFANVLARSTDGVHFAPVTTVTSDEFGAASLERPALVPVDDGGFRLYVSCSTWHSKHWSVEALEINPDGEVEGRKTVLPGDEATTAWKDVVVHRSAQQWQMWACRHPLAGGDDEADRMSSWYATSADGWEWEWHGAALTPTAGRWDARGTRIASVLRVSEGWLAFYDGRASAQENWHERTGLALGAGPEAFTAQGGPTPAGQTARYLSLAELPDGYRLYWEASRVDGAHDLRTAYVPRPESPTQS
ncbi:MAG TPA: hypothetical protein VGH43_07725 [Jatrophihabitans sp.]|jgi:hypothetical protein